MKRFKLLLCLLFVLHNTTAYTFQNQDDEAFIKHTVTKGQNVYQIGRIYGASPQEILRINPNAQDGIEVDEVLLIPKSGKSLLDIEKSKTLEENWKPIVGKPLSSEGTHMVKPQETVYSLAKTYGLTLSELVDANPHLAYGLKIGQVLTIPVPFKGKKSDSTTPSETPKEVKSKQEIAPVVKKEVTATNSKPLDKGSYIEHIVEEKETKWSISQKYGITVQDIEENNPDSDILSIGEVMRIPKEKGVVVAKENNVVSKEKAIITQPAQEEVKKEVAKEKQQVTETKVKESKAIQEPKSPTSNTKTVTPTPQATKQQQENFIKTINGKENTSSELDLPSKSNLFDKIINRPVYADLSSTVNKESQKELVLLLPFNLAQIKSDTLSTVKTQLKNNRFLNMTLDFYSGALMAIDSASRMGLKINVRILDSDESKENSNIESVIAKHDFTNVNAVIGPFKSVNIGKTTKVLSRYNVPVISPLSKESIKLDYEYLYNSIPPKEVTQKALLDYFKTKDVNVIALVDNKQVRAKNFLIKNYDQIKFATIDSTGTLGESTISAMLIKNKKNIVVLETERPRVILRAIEYLNKQKELGYMVDLATMDMNGAFDNPEIPLVKLVKLNLHYPSLTREDGDRNQTTFAKKYKSQNNVFPNQYAIRGFDLTFDVILRLAQDISFKETMIKYETEYVENRFSYDKDAEGGYFNRGVYVLRYDEDFTIKKLK